mmetsp:Transcript_14217/g.28811  ORF Transcript_14217/g.28811 Transcript_14217/m.28811 type:complete len:308 (+) Transcript_14217:146-1069(+)
MWCAKSPRALDADHLGCLANGGERADDAIHRGLERGGGDDSGLARRGHLHLDARRCERAERGLGALVAHAQKVAADALLHAGAHHRVELRRRHAKRGHAVAAREVDDVGDARRRGGVAPRAPPLREHGPHVIANGEETVEHAMGSAEPCVLGDERGVDPLEHNRPSLRCLRNGHRQRRAAARGLGLDTRAERVGLEVDTLLDGLDAGSDPEQLDRETQLTGEGHVSTRDVADALGVHGVVFRQAAGRDCGDQRELVSRIDPVDIQVGRRLGVPEGLCLGEHVVEASAGFLHGRQYEVARAVEDSGRV